jgi:hypothetical protein
MWQRFTERARKAVFAAQDSAKTLGDTYVSTEHLLLGVLKEPSNEILGVCMKFNAPIVDMVQKIHDQIPKPSSTSTPITDFTLTPRAKRVIDLAYDETRNMNDQHLTDIHLFLGLMREGDGLAGRILAKFGLELDACRKWICEARKQANKDTVNEILRGRTTNVMIDDKAEISDEELHVDSDSFLGDMQLVAEFIGKIIKEHNEHAPTEFDALLNLKLVKLSAIEAVSVMFKGAEKLAAIESISQVFDDLTALAMNLSPHDIFADERFRQALIEEMRDAM